jgi:hypothetical protein
MYRRHVCYHASVWFQFAPTYTRLTLAIGGGVVVSGGGFSFIL